MWFRMRVRRRERLRVTVLRSENAVDRTWQDPRQDIDPHSILLNGTINCNLFSF
jgi:hypothetical protein